MRDWTALTADVDRIVGKHYTAGRAGEQIRFVVLHHNAGTLSVEDCYQAWQMREASAHYQVTSDGTIGQLVRDADTAWHAGNMQANRQSIGIEHANNQLAPDWTISDATLDNGAHLVAVICRYYGLGRPEWMVNVFPHQHFTSTACPGAIAGSQQAAYMARAQQYYDRNGQDSTDLEGIFTMDELKTIAATLTPGQAGVKDAGGVFALLVEMNQHLKTISDALTRGQEGVKTAGDVITAVLDGSTK